MNEIEESSLHTPITNTSKSFQSLTTCQGGHSLAGRRYKNEDYFHMDGRHNLWIISDEIHCDLIRVGKKHIPMSKVMPDYNKLVTCMSASKTFNMAGLQFSNVIIPDKETREEFIRADKIGGFVNPLSLAGQKAGVRMRVPRLRYCEVYWRL
jgi:bifunctional pyridoxal-dependent enzyme with beta-cystathionase and maltose regulon repressor activities